MKPTNAHVSRICTLQKSSDDAFEAERVLRQRLEYFRLKSDFLEILHPEALADHTKRKRDENRNEKNTHQCFRPPIQCARIPKEFISADEYGEVWLGNILCAAQAEVVEARRQPQTAFEARLRSVFTLPKPSSNKFEPSRTRLVFTPQNRNETCARLSPHDVISIYLPGLEVVGVVRTVDSYHRQSSTTAEAYTFITPVKIEPKLPMKCTIRRHMGLASVFGSMEACFFLEQMIPYANQILKPAEAKLQGKCNALQSRYDSLNERSSSQKYNATQRAVISHMSRTEFSRITMKKIDTSAASAPGSTLSSLGNWISLDTMSHSAELVVVQGPPGTGKTHTIVGILYNLLVQSTHAYAKETIMGKLLVCAASNTAVDEILLRTIKEAKDLNVPIPSMVRLGARERVNPVVAQQGYLFEDILRKQFGDHKYGSVTTGKKIEIAPREHILSQFQIVFSTIGSLRTEGIKFDTVIIDEAGQITEPQTIFALSHACRRAALIGDPMQLPPTVFGRKSIRNKYDRSLMERMLENGYPFFFLSEQYRMHPDLCALPSELFYGGRLKTGQRVNISGDREYSSRRRIHLENVTGSEKLHGTSYYNDEEVDAVLRIIENLIKTLKGNPNKGCRDATVGVITPYLAQQMKIKSKLLEALPTTFANNQGEFVNATRESSVVVSHNESGIASVEVNTVDGYQGREKDVIIISCVRCIKEADCPLINRRDRVSSDSTLNSRPQYGELLTFLDDRQRANVALTRARELIYIVGSERTLRTCCPVWKEVLDFTR